MIVVGVFFGGGGGVKFLTQNISKWARLEEKKGEAPHQFWPSSLIKVQVLKPKKLTVRGAQGASKGFRQATWIKRQNTEEGSRDMQVRERGSFLAKYPSPQKSMHCTNSTSQINDKMTPEHFTAYSTFYHLQRSLDGKSIQIKTNGCSSGGLAYTLNSYIRKKDSYREGDGKI